MIIKIGTRKSKLSRIQTDLVITQIQNYFPDVKCVVVPISTTGDQITNQHLYDIGGKALFLKEIEKELLAGNVDLAVHSFKDVPAKLPDGLSISAVLERHDPRDCFISFKYKTLFEIPEGGIIGTSSMRKKILLQKLRPDLKTTILRGNIHSRLEKLKNGKIDATILATAGLKRAKLFNEDFCTILSIDEMLPSPCQGIIAVEIRKNDLNMLEICKAINHTGTWNLARAERSFLEYLNASCETPLAALATIKNNQLVAKYMLADTEGKAIEYHVESGNIDQAETIGTNAARILQDKINS